MNNQDRDALLIRVDERIKSIDEKLNRHLDSHAWINRGLFGAFLSGLLAMAAWVFNAITK